MGTRLDKDYQEILKHYYTGISIATKPIVVTNDSVTQEFYLDSKKGKLVIENLAKAKQLSVDVNGTLLEVELNNGFLNKIQEYDISKYLKKGNNEIVFKVPDLNKTLKVYVDFSSIEEEDK